MNYSDFQGNIQIFFGFTGSAKHIQIGILQRLNPRPQSSNDIFDLDTCYETLFKFKMSCCWSFFYFGNSSFGTTAWVVIIIVVMIIILSLSCMQGCYLEANCTFNHLFTIINEHILLQNRGTVKPPMIQWRHHWFSNTNSCFTKYVAWFGLVHPHSLIRRVV